MLFGLFNDYQTVIEPKKLHIEAGTDTKVMGYCQQKAMSYGLSKDYELWVQFMREPSWWIKKSMRYKRL